MIIRQLKDRGKTAAAAKSLIGYLLGPDKELGFVSEYPRDVGKRLIVKEASAREGRACYYHFVSSVRFDENPTPSVWDYCQNEIKAALGLSNNPHLSATHYETDCFHLHTMVGAVDMGTGNVVSPFNAYYKLGVVRKTMERNFSLSVSNDNGRGLYFRGMGGVRPKWDSFYSDERGAIVKKMIESSDKAGDWQEFSRFLLGHHELVLLCSGFHRDLAVFDRANRWLFDSFATETIDALEARLGAFPYESVDSVQEFLKNSEIGSLRPRALDGVDLIDVDIFRAKQAIVSRYSRARISSSNSSIKNYGASLSVSLADHASGRVGIYSNGVEPYTSSEVDVSGCMNIAKLLIDSGCAAPRVLQVDSPAVSNERSNVNVSMVTPKKR